MTNTRREHRRLPHTADTRIKAWGPTRHECLAEAAAALVGGFADVSGTGPERTVTDLAAETDEDRLLVLLDEIIYLLDTEGAVSLDVEVRCRPGGLEVRMPVTETHRVEHTGAAPKAIALHGLRFTTDGHAWWCTATIDV